jgi:hypothetical protein
MRARVVLMVGLTLALSSLLALDVSAQGGRRGRGNGEPAGPAPRGADGRPTFGGENGEIGTWQGSFGGFGTLTADGGRDGDGPTYDSVPFQDWALALYIDRQTHELEPHARCKASGISRQFQTPYGAEFVEFPELQRIYIFDNGGPHTFRTIYMDGRNHPDGADLDANGYGHSIGWWDGDTLVVDTVGFDTSFWLDRRGIPHTEQLRTLERFTRVDFRTMEYEVTFEDPGALTEPWTGSFDISFNPGNELFEYICQQANYAHELMIGDQQSVDRSAPIIP